VEIRNGRDVAGQVMTKPDQEGLIVKNIINRPVAGASGIILLSSELPPGKVHLLHRHPNAEQIMYVLEGACLALSEGGAMRLGEGDAVFIAKGEWHGVRNDSDRPVVTLVIYAGAGTLEIEPPYGTTPHRSTSSLRTSLHPDGVALSGAGHHSF
jgi:quercetin dioxygenase-like cupin family protein